jgi:hypothetical protein
MNSPEPDSVGINREVWGNGFEILDLIEMQAPADAATHEFYDYVQADWAKQWPSEEIWVARKVAG